MYVVFAVFSLSLSLPLVCTRTTHTNTKSMLRWPGRKKKNFGPKTWNMNVDHGAGHIIFIRKLLFFDDFDGDDKDVTVSR